MDYDRIENQGTWREKSELSPLMEVVELIASEPVYNTSTVTYNNVGNCFKKVA